VLSSDPEYIYTVRAHGIGQRTNQLAFPMSASLMDVPTRHATQHALFPATDSASHSTRTLSSRRLAGLRIVYERAESRSHETQSLADALSAADYDHCVHACVAISTDARAIHKCSEAQLLRPRVIVNKHTQTQPPHTLPLRPRASANTPPECPSSVCRRVPSSHDHTQIVQSRDAE
jgi:hypothetical protein